MAREERMAHFIEMERILRTTKLDAIPSMADTARLGLILDTVRRAAVAEERERCAKLADQSAAEAAERGPMIGGSPMHPQEVMDRRLGELVSKNIAAAIRGPDAPK